MKTNNLKSYNDRLDQSKPKAGKGTFTFIKLPVVIIKDCESVKKRL